MVNKYLVTGASGYIATHVIDQLLKQGHSVRGTVRSLNDKQKVDQLKKLGPVELVEADLLNPESWKNAVKDIDVVFHVASPLPIAHTGDEDLLIKPAVEGTLNVLKAASEAKVRRVVLTSSVITIYNLDLDDKTYNEKDWVPAEKSKMPYQKSKILAEKAAWNFYEEQKKAGKGFELVTILPSWVLGPPLTASGCASVTLFSSVFGQESARNFNTSVCDVRDVALAHLRAAETPEANGQRIIVSSADTYSTFDWVGILNQAGYKVAKVEGSNDPSSYSKTKFDNSKLKNLLKIQPTEVKKTVLDMAESLVKFGVVKA